MPIKDVHDVITKVEPIDTDQRSKCNKTWKANISETKLTQNEKLL